MSRTDKTRPFWVKMQETPNVTCIPYHDHRTEPCDLPERPPKDGYHRTRTRCWWTYSIRFITSGDSRCPCHTCGDRYWVHAATRKARQEARREANTARREYRTGLGSYND